MARINLTRIYTRLGDDGETHLGDMSRVSKNDARIEAFGAVDELNAQLGVLLSSDVGLPGEFTPWLVRIQNDLFDVGADLSLPEGSKQGTPLRVTPGQTEWLEQRCDEVNADLEPLRSFVLPGGTAAAAGLSLCRAVCRRAERRVLAVDGASPEVARYLNRLSDLLFILSRAAAGGRERLWVPGESRDSIDRS